MGIFKIYGTGAIPEFTNVNILLLTAILTFIISIMELKKIKPQLTEVAANFRLMVKA